MLYSLVGSIKSGALMDHEHPRFMRAVDWTSKSGLDNPDNNYYVALISDNADYRITGNRGNTRGLVFQLVIGQPGVKGAGSSTNVGVLDINNMHINDDGSFEIIISRNDPGNEVNWLPSGVGAETVIARFTHSDWHAERDGRLLIEKVVQENTEIPILSEAIMAKKINNTAISLFDRTATWLDFSKKIWTLMPRNDISKVKPSKGGLVGQYSSFGTWDLQDDEALILTSYPSEAQYQGIELGSRWFVSLDYESRTSSLTLDQAYQSGDGAYRFVISAKDPGIQNWLDTEQHPQGLIMMRWQGLKNSLPEKLHPHAMLVKFDQIKELLPADTPAFNPKDRQQQRRLRSLSIQGRFGS